MDILEAVDIVYLWVDGSDPDWRRKRQSARQSLDARQGRAMALYGNVEGRFRDNDELRCSLRALERFFPQHGHVYIITDGQTPPWLAAHPQLTIVDHRELIPACALPTFDSCHIESYIHRIPQLSERYFYFNDDVFFGAPVLGFEVSPWLAAGIALTLNTSAFLGEIWRGCIQAIPSGQWEAAEALGLSYTARMRFVILPQAWKIALPPTVGYLVQVLKGTSLAAIIGFAEITRTGQIINNVTFQPLIVFSCVGAMYFVLCWPLSLLASRMEKRLQVGSAR